MVKRILNSSVLHDTITSAAVSDPKLVEDFRHGVIDVIATSAAATIKVKVSNQALPPDFSAASTPTNHWTFVDLIGRDDGGVTVIGTTGIVLSTESVNNTYAINTDAIRWVAVDVDPITTGSVSVLLSAATNE